MRRGILPLILTAALLLGNSWAAAQIDQEGTFAAAQKGKTADEFSSEVASTWFELLYDVVKVERTPPPGASRIYALTAV